MLSLTAIDQSIPTHGTVKAAQAWLERQPTKASPAAPAIP
jgi:hypothetical protein